MVRDYLLQVLSNDFTPPSAVSHIYIIINIAISIILSVFFNILCSNGEETDKLVNICLIQMILNNPRPLNY